MAIIRFGHRWHRLSDLGKERFVFATFRDRLEKKCHRFLRYESSLLLYLS